MSDNANLDKLFEAALHEKQAPSRFGTPEELRKSTPAAFNRTVPGEVGQGDVSAFRPAPSAFKAAPAPFQAASSVFQAVAAVPVQQPAAGRDTQAEASLDSSINAELAAIMNAKVAKEKRRRKRGFLMTILFFVGVTAGATGWVVSNPDRFESLKLAIAEIRSVGDIQGMVAKYKEDLDKVAVRGQQIDAATVSMGVGPASVDEQEDPGLDKEMQAMMGENGGKSTAAREKLLREKFKTVEETGSLMPNKKGEEGNTREEKAEELPDQVE